MQEALSLSRSLSFGFSIKGLYGMGGEGIILHSQPDLSKSCECAYSAHTYRHLIPETILDGNNNELYWATKLIE